MAINPRRKFTQGLDNKRIKMIRYFTILIIVAIPLYLAYQSLQNIKPKKDEIQKVTIETGDRPIEKQIKIKIKAEGGLNFRKEANKNAEKIGEIPDGTELTVSKEIEGWYEIEFDGKKGWVAKEFTVTEANAKEKEAKDEATKNWIDLKNPYGFTLKYPNGWSAQDYGKQPDGDSIVGLSFSQLPSTLQQGFFMPVDIRVSDKKQDILEASLESLVKKTKTEIDINGTKGIKYTYTDSVDSTEKTRIFISKGTKTIVISENGGYGTELENILKTFKAL